MANTSEPGTRFSDGRTGVVGGIEWTFGDGDVPRGLHEGRELLRSSPSSG